MSRWPYNAVCGIVVLQCSILRTVQDIVQHYAHKHTHPNAQRTTHNTRPGSRSTTNNRPGQEEQAGIYDLHQLFTLRSPMDGQPKIGRSVTRWDGIEGLRARRAGGSLSRRFFPNRITWAVAAILKKGIVDKHGTYIHIHATPKQKADNGRHIRIQVI